MPPASKEKLVKDELNEVIPALYAGLNVSLGGQILPKPGDDLEWTYGTKLYRHMLKEPVLAALDDIVRMLVLEADCEYVPSVAAPTAMAEDDPDYDEDLAEFTKADEIKKLVEYRLGKLQTSLRTVLWEALEGYATGHRLIEKVFGMADGGITIVDLRAKSREMYNLVVSPFFDVLGIRPGVTNVGFTEIANLPSGDTYYPIDRFWLFTPKTQDGDPRGVAALRPCYAPYYDKLLTRPESIKFMKQLGGGMVSLELPEITSKNEYITFADGTKKARVIYYQELLASFAINGGAFAIENGGKLNVHANNGEGKAFEAKFDRCDREMVLAFAKSIRAVLEAQHGSKADSETSLGLLKSLVNWLRSTLCESFQKVIYHIVLLEAGKDAAEYYCPTMAMPEAKTEDIPALLSAISTALTAGVITPEQMPYWDQKLGQPVADRPDPEEVDTEEEAPEEGATFRTPKKVKYPIGERLSTRHAKASEEITRSC